MRFRLPWGVLAMLIALLAGGLVAGGCLDFKANNPVAVFDRDNGGDDGGGTDEPPPPPPAPPGSVRVHFVTVSNGQPLGRHPGELNTNDAGESFFSSDVQYLVSDFRLISTTGPRAEYAADIVHLVDAVTDQTGNTHFVTLENIPPDTYTTLRFRMGLTEERQQTFDPDTDLTLQFGEFSLDFKLDRQDGSGLVDYFRHVGLVFPTFQNILVGMGPADGTDFSSEVEIDLGAGLVIAEETTANLEATFDVNGLLYEGATALTFGELDALGASSESALQSVLRDNVASNTWSVIVP